MRVDDPVLEVEIPRFIPLAHDPHGCFGAGEKQNQGSQAEQQFQMEGFQGKSYNSGKGAISR